MSQIIGQELSQLAAKVGREQEIMKGVCEFLKQISHVPLTSATQFKITNEMAEFLLPQLKRYPLAIAFNAFEGYYLNVNELPCNYLNVLQTFVSEQKQRRIAMSIDIPAIRIKFEQAILSGHYRSGQVLTFSVDKLGESTDVGFLKSQLEHQGFSVEQRTTDEGGMACGGSVYYVISLLLS